MKVVASVVAGDTNAAFQDGTYSMMEQFPQQWNSRDVTRQNTSQGNVSMMQPSIILLTLHAITCPSMTCRVDDSDCGGP